MDKIYFAHPTSMYNERWEDAFETLIAHYLTKGDKGMIENPNQPQHQVGYNNYAQRKKESGIDHKGMSYFYDEVLPNCSGCVGVPFLDGRLGLGVAGEMKWFLERNKPIWIVELVLPPVCYTGDFLNNPLCGLFIVRPVNSEEKEHLLTDNPKLVVPHQETRLRSWIVYNRIVRPYHEAHTVKMPIPEGFYPEG